MKKKIALLALVILIICQLFQIDKTQKPVDPNLDFFNSAVNDAQAMTLIKQACKDCHSHEVNYPGYTKVQPIGWWIKGHIKSGVKKLNFSEWNSYSSEKKQSRLQECIEVLEENRMPLKSYTWLHEEGKLSEEDKLKIIALFKNLQ